MLIEVPDAWERMRKGYLSQTSLFEAVDEYESYYDQSEGNEDDFEDDEED